MAFDIFEKVIAFSRRNSLFDEADRIIAGVSGGPDSLCLLHILVRFSRKFGAPVPTVAHLNHQLRGADSQADEDFVKEIARQWQLPVVIERENIAALANSRKQSVEEAARQFRYAFLWRVAGETGANRVAVGHNADDQVETILMHLLRGAGLAGLRGILPKVDLASLGLHPDDVSSSSTNRETEASPKLIRPLLEISRADIEAYCQANGLSPRQDYSNQDVTFFRNRLRHELIPHLESYNPNIRQVLQNTAKVITADVQVLRQALDKSWPVVVINESPQQITFDLARWRTLPLALKRSTLREAVERLRRGLRNIGFGHIENAVEILERSETGAQMTLPQGLLLTVGYETFVVAPADRPYSMEGFQGPQIQSDEILPVNLPGITPLPATDWYLRANLLARESVGDEEIKQAASRWEIYLDAGTISKQLVLRSRRPEDRFYPLGMDGHRKKLNKFMIDKKIPADWRDHVPLLVSNHQILWICGYQPAEQARVKPTTRQLVHLRFDQINTII